MSRIRTWALRFLAGSVIPLIWKIYSVVVGLAGVLRYILQDIVDGKLEIPEGSPVHDTWSAALRAVDAVASALERVLIFFGEDVVVQSVPANSEAVDGLDSRVKDLAAAIDALPAGLRMKE